MTTNEVTAYDFSLSLHMKQIRRMLSKAVENFFRGMKNDMHYGYEYDLASLQEVNHP